MSAARLRRPAPRTGFWLAMGAITFLGLALRVLGITDQPPIRDEIMSAFTAENYVEHGLFGPTMPFHPNLRNLLLYGSTRAFGAGLTGLRGPSLLLGTLSLPLLGLLIWRLTGDRLAAALAAFFLAVDPVHITFSRQSIQEVHTAFLALLGVWLFLLAFDERWQVRRLGWLPLAGIALGLAAASKHHGLFPLLACLGLGLFWTLRRRQWPQAALLVSCLSVLPLAVYLLTYQPWFGRGYRWADWPPMQLALVEEMATHTGYADSSVIDDRPWQWFLRPLMGYGNFSQVDGRPYVTIAMGNPLVWMLVLPAAAYLALPRHRSSGDMKLQVLFWVSYLPLALSPRPIWLLSSVAVIPFACGLVGRFLSQWVPPEKRRWLAAYAAVVLIASLLLYPMAVGRAWETVYLRHLVVRFNPHP